MTTSVNRRKRLVMYVVDTKTRAVDNMCWLTFGNLRDTLIFFVSLAKRDTLDHYMVAVHCYLASGA